MSGPEFQANIRKYLLGQLSGEDLEVIERQLLTENEVYEEIEIAEDELVDDYVNGELSSDDRRLFEEKFLADLNSHAKLRLGYALAAHLSDQSHPAPDSPSHRPLKTSAKSYAVAAVLLAIAVVASVIAFKLLRNSRGEKGPVLAVELAPGRTRDTDEVKTISIPARNQSVEFNLRIAESDQFRSYGAVLYSADGSEKFSDTGLTAHGSEAVAFRVKGALLASGDYYIKLSGLNSQNVYEDLSRYYFRVR